MLGDVRQRKNKAATSDNLHPVCSAVEQRKGMPISNTPSHFGRGSEDPAPSEPATTVAAKLLWSLMFLCMTVSYNFTTTTWVLPGYPYPGATLLAQLALSILFHIPVSYLGQYTKNEFLQKNVPVIRFSFYILVKVLPGTFLFVGANLMAFKLLHLIGLELADVTKSLTLFVTALLQQFLLQKSTPVVSWIGVFITGSSFFLILGKVNVRPLLIGLIATGFSSARTVVSARQMKHVDGQGGVMSFYNAVTGLLLIPFYVWILEYAPSDGHNPLEDIITGNTPILLPASAVIGFITNVVAFGFMGIVTPTTYNLVSQVKQLSTAMLGILINPASQTSTVIIPNLIKFSGGVLYVVGKNMGAAPQAEDKHFLTDTETEYVSATQKYV